jgi:hypothetical protein
MSLKASEMSGLSHSLSEDLEGFEWAVTREVMICM